MTRGGQFFISLGGQFLISPDNPVSHDELAALDADNKRLKRLLAERLRAQNFRLKRMLERFDG
ncbi:hypothetical protein GHK80_13585 [Sinorhizobium medicae]|nr:hypothetical protein [Sinorhizobium medicae]